MGKRKGVARHASRNVSRANHLSRRAAVLFPLFVITIFCVLDLSRKTIIAFEHQNTGELLSFANFNKALVVLVGYYSTTLLTTAFFMFLQQYFYKTERYFYSIEDGFFIFSLSLFYCICNAAYIMFFDRYLLASLLEVIISIVLASQITSFANNDSNNTMNNKDPGRFSA